MWKGGSCEREAFSNGISNIPVVGDVNQAVIAATGHDYIAGSDVSGWSGEWPSSECSCEQRTHSMEYSKQVGIRYKDKPWDVSSDRNPYHGGLVQVKPSASQRNALRRGVKILTVYKLSRLLMVTW
jgi:hypothetical protein